MTVICSCGNPFYPEVEDGLNYCTCEHCGKEYEICVEVSQLWDDEEDENNGQ